MSAEEAAPHKRKRPLNDGGVRAASDALLADGAWHDLNEVIAAMAKVVPHGLASREGWAPIGSPLSRKIANGAQRIAIIRLSSALKDGRYQATQPLPLGKRVYRGEVPCQIRDRLPGSIALSIVLRDYAHTSMDWLKERPGLVALLPWADKPWGRIIPKDIPALVELVQRWKAEESDAEVRFNAAYRKATPDARKDMLLYVEGRTGWRPVDAGATAVGESGDRRGGDASGEQRH